MVTDQKGFPHYGDIYQVDLEPMVGSETGKKRPALIVSNDSNNEFSDTVTVLPITGQPAKKSYPFEVLVPKGIDGLTEDSRVKANQIRTVDKSRLLRFRGVLPKSLHTLVKQAIRHHLEIE